MDFVYNLALRAKLGKFANTFTLKQRGHSTAHRQGKKMIHAKKHHQVEHREDAQMVVEQNLGGSSFSIEREMK